MGKMKTKSGRELNPMEAFRKQEKKRNRKDKVGRPNTSSDEISRLETLFSKGQLDELGITQLKRLKQKLEKRNVFPPLPFDIQPGYDDVEMPMEKPKSTFSGVSIVKEAVLIPRENVEESVTKKTMMVPSHIVKKKLKLEAEYEKFKKDTE